MTDTMLDPIPILTFMLGTERYALLIDYVVEVAAMVEYSTIADASPAFLGIINRHGQVMPLIDLRKVFNLSTPPINTNVLFIVSKFEDTLVGLVVDAVNQVEYIQAKDLRVAPGGGRWIEQVASHNEQLIQLINLPTIIHELLSDTITTKQEIEDK